jgi:hypothetical protein
MTFKKWKFCNVGSSSGERHKRRPAPTPHARALAHQGRARFERRIRVLVFRYVLISSFLDTSRRQIVIP